MEAPRPNPVPQRRYSEPNLGRSQKLQGTPEGSPTRPVRSLSAGELRTPPPASDKTPTSPDTTGTPLSQRQARAPADPEAVRQRLRASAGIHNASRRRLDLSVIGRFDPVKNRGQAIARTLAHVQSNAVRPRIVREANRPQHLGVELEGALLRQGVDDAVGRAGGNDAAARYDNDLLMYAGFKLAGRYDAEQGIPHYAVADTFVALIEAALEDPKMDARSLRFLTAGFFPGLTMEAGRMTALAFFERFGEQAQIDPRLKAVAQGLSMTMSEPIRASVRTLLEKQESASAVPVAAGTPGTPIASAAHALKLFNEVDGYRDRDGFWKDRLKSTLHEIDGRIFNPRQFAQELRAQWQWPGPTHKPSGKSRPKPDRPDPARQPPATTPKPLSSVPADLSTDEPFDTGGDTEAGLPHIVQDLQTDDPSEDIDDPEADRRPEGVPPAEGRNEDEAEDGAADDEN